MTTPDLFVNQLNNAKGKPVKRQGRKAIGSKVLNQHYDSLVAALTVCPKPARFFAAGFLFLTREGRWLIPSFENITTI